jgi:hypothetical protein
MRRLPIPFAAAVLLVAASRAPSALASDPPPAAPAAPAPAPAGLMYDPRFREGKPEDVLAKTEPVLLRRDLDAFVDLFEAAYDVALGPAEEQRFRDAVETGWPVWDSTAREAAKRRPAERDAVVTALGAGDAAGATRLLDAFRSEQDARLSAAPTAAYHQPLVQAKRRASEPFSPGKPTVTVAAQDAFEQMALFLLRVARNEDAPITDGQIVALREQTKKAMDATGDAVRRHYARTPRLWRVVRSRWQSADDEVRLRMRWAAVRAFRWIVGLSPTEGPPTTRGDLAAYAAAAQEVAAKGPAFDQAALAFQNPQALFDAAVEALGLSRGEIDKALALDPLVVR